MPTIGFNIYDIKANIAEEGTQGKQINISSTPKIIDINKKELNLKGITEALKIDFGFVTKYEPGVGEVELKGELVFQCDNIDETMNMWKDKKVLNKAIALEVMNTIMRRSLIKVIYLADDLRLPPPINFPLFKMEDKKE